MKNIRIHPDFKHQLAEEFNTSLQSVSMSLKGVFQSKKANKIRNRTKELLLAEAAKITENI